MQSLCVNYITYLFRLFVLGFYNEYEFDKAYNCNVVAYVN